MLKPIRWLNAIPIVVLVFLPAFVSAQAVVDYNASNGQLTIDTTGGVGGAGFNLVSVKLPGPAATSIDRWLDGTSQDTVPAWVQVYFNNAEQWTALSNGGASSPTSAVPPGVYQIATYSPGLTLGSFLGDAPAGIGAGQIELGGWTSTSAPGTIELVNVGLTVGPSYPCDYVGALGCDINDIDALYAGTNGAPAPLTNGAIATWLSQASDPANPLKASTADTYVLGDADLNGDVDSTDLGLHLNNFGSTAGLGWGQGNFNSDPDVDSTDLGLLLNNFAYTSFSTSAVPEPTSLSLLLLSILGLVAIRRRWT